jgi:signal transduction histidine kinase
MLVRGATECPCQAARRRYADAGMAGTALLCTLRAAGQGDATGLGGLDELGELHALGGLGGLAAQAIGAAALGLVFAALAWQPMAVRGARAWAAAHALFACAALALVLRVALWPTAVPFSWEHENALAVRALYAFHIAARVAGLFLLFAGIRAYARAPVGGRVIALGIAAAALLGIAGQRFAVDLAGAMAVQAPLCALGFAACAVALFALPGPARGRDSRATALACAALAALWATAAHALGALGGEASAPGDGPLALAVAHAPQADLALCLCAALGLVAMLRRQQRVEASERAAKLAALEQRLAQAQRMEAVGMIVSGVAHELSAPLTAILGYTEPNAGQSPLAPSATALRVAHEQARRCKAIVADLLTFSGSREERWEDLELRELATSVIDGLRNETTARGVEVALADGSPVVMRGDAIGLQQVLSNLVMNAAQALGAGGKVRVGAARDGEHALFWVEDDGAGVPLELQERIFEPFFTTKAAAKGSGLGLTISHGIVRSHGGTLRVKNLAHPRHGARFIVRLPLRTIGPVAATPWPRLASRSNPPSRPRTHRPPSQRGSQRPKLTPQEPLPVRELVPQPPAPAHASPAIGARTGGTRRICVIEDDAAVLSLLHAVFERERWEVGSFDDPRAALAVLRAGAQFDAIVSDVEMPHLSGAELYEILARERPELLSRLVFVTGDAWRPDLRPLRDVGTCAILSKPLDLRQLVEACSQRCAV